MKKATLDKIKIYTHALRLFIFDRDKRFIMLRDKGRLDKMDDRKYLERLWKISMGYKIDLDNPRTFNEKLQWIKLNDRDALYNTLVDKIEAKKWVADRIGGKYIIPTLGVWDDPEDIDFETLPDRFVVKCNHNSGVGMYICTDKSELDAERVRDSLREGLAQNYYLPHREWAYKDVPHRILAEEYLNYTDDIANRYGLIDYKVHCFGGKPDFIEVIGNRDYQAGTARSDNYDFDWNKLDWCFGDYPEFTEEIPRPENLSELYELSKELSKDLRYARVDFYNVNGNLKFGEITLYPNAGMVFYNSEYTPEIDRMLGDKINLE